MEEIVVDNFAGGGGASTGIEMAIGRSVDIAINHDPAAIAMHRANHPTTTHYQEDVWKVDPKEACAGRPVALAWFSPDCKHHSRAKGGKPVSRKIRALAWVAVKWAKAVHPRVIMLENVEEFRDWGRLDENDRPDPRYKGETFQRFIRQLEWNGYTVEHRLLRACDYGAPTSRRRLFLIARCDGRPIVWPEPTHGDPEGLEVRAGLKKPWVPVREVLDFSLPCPSIFDSSEEIMEKYGIRAVRPLSEKTMKRIMQGVEMYGGKPFLIQYHESPEFRGQDIERPIQTIDASNRYGLCRFLTEYYSSALNVSVNKPAPTITTHDRFALVESSGQDIGMRMLTPRELFDAQGFPGDYIIDHDADGRDYPRSEQVARCGNAVCPPIPAALVRANLPELCGKENTNGQAQNCL